VGNNINLAMSDIKIIEGAKDILPKDHQYFTYFKKVVRHRCRHSGYRRFTTPLFEDANLFQKSFALSDEELAKFFTCSLKENCKAMLVADRLPAMIRAYFEHNMRDWAQPVELYYIEPVFRRMTEGKYEYLQSQCFGLSVIGETDAAIDAQVIQLLYQILDDLGVSHLVTLKLNNVGSIDDQKNYAQALQDFYIGKERSLCENCNKNLLVKPLKLLSCQEEDCKILAEIAPKFSQFLSQDSVAYLESVKEYLKEIDVPFTIDEKLFLSELYYSNLVFDFVGTDKVTDSIATGGRADPLTKILGYECDLFAFGAKMNADAVIAMMKKEKIKVPSKDNLHVFVAQLGPEAKIKCLRLIKDLRDIGVKSVGALGKGSMKEQLRLAQQFKVPYTILMGLTEVKEGVAIIRNMEKGTQAIILYDQILDEVVKLIGESNLDKYHPGELVYS